MPNPLKRDPSRTTMLRKRYMADMKRRIAKVSRAIQELIVKDDALGLDTSKPLTFHQQVPKQAWRFKFDANKVKEYRKWLQQQIDAKILTVHAVSGKPWTATYAESAYRKGMTKAYTQVHKQALAADVAFYEGGKAQFLREAFASPISLSKIELMYTRAFDELKGVTAAMGQQMSRILASGMIKGDGSRAIARELRKNVATITSKRALVIARTEVIYAHAEGQLDAFERLGVKELGLMAEWLTAGDDRVCENCGALEGHVFTVDEARGILPLHPNCRCAWMPFMKGVSKRRTKKEIREKLKFAIPRWPSTKRKVKVEPSLPTESRVGTTFTKTTSKEFNNIVNETIDTYPERVKLALNDSGISFKAGSKMTEIYPELKGKHPKGWSAGTTYDSVDGLYDRKTKSISISESYRPIGKKDFVKTSKADIIGVLNHETGHGFNTSFAISGESYMPLYAKADMYSNTIEFKTVYKKDFNVMTKMEIRSRDLTYYNQPGEAGRSETFAEVFACIMGRGCTTKDIRPFFPNSLKFIEDLLK